MEERKSHIQVMRDLMKKNVKELQLFFYCNDINTGALILKHTQYWKERTLHMINYDVGIIFSMSQRLRAIKVFLQQLIVTSLSSASV